MKLTDHAQICPGINGSLVRSRGKDQDALRGKKQTSRRLGGGKKSGKDRNGFLEARYFNQVNQWET